MSIAEANPMTADQLLAIPESDCYELIQGRLVSAISGALASWIGGQFYAKLRAYAEESGAGFALPAGCGLKCFSAETNVFRPNACFVCTSRWTPGGLSREFLHCAPDAVAEVLSPTDEICDVDIKVDEYLRAGVRLVWLVNPDTRTVQVYRPSGEGTRLHAGDTLSGEDVLPGFACGVGELFPAK